MTKEAQINILSKILKEIDSFIENYNISSFNGKIEEINKLIRKIEKNTRCNEKYSHIVKNIAIETKKAIELKSKETENKKSNRGRIPNAS